MKKALALVLSVLVVISMFSMAASAATVDINEANVIVNFVVSDVTVKTVGYSSIKNAEAMDFPDENQAPKQYESPNGDKKYTFVGWKSNIDGEIYYAGTLRDHPEAAEIILVAEYSEEDMSLRQSFWELVESIFARINLIFEYFATIFNF